MPSALAIAWPLYLLTVMIEWHRLAECPLRLQSDTLTKSTSATTSHI